MSSLTEKKNVLNIEDMRFFIDELKWEMRIEINKIKFVSYALELICNDETYGYGFFGGISPILDSIFPKLETILEDISVFEDFLIKK